MNFVDVSDFGTISASLLYPNISGNCTGGDLPSLSGSGSFISNLASSNSQIKFCIFSTLLDLLYISFAFFNSLWS